MTKMYSRPSLEHDEAQRWCYAKYRVSLISKSPVDNRGRYRIWRDDVEFYGPTDVMSSCRPYSIVGECLDRLANTKSKEIMGEYGKLRIEWIKTVD